MRSEMYNSNTSEVGMLPCRRGKFIILKLKLFVFELKTLIFKVCLNACDYAILSFYLKFLCYCFKSLENKKVENTPKET